MLRYWKVSPLYCCHTRSFYFALALIFCLSYQVYSLRVSQRRDSPTVNVILSSLAKDDTSWTKDLHIPAVEIIKYVADNESALYHPPQNKGNEAMIYLSYCYEFYEDLPDISIFTHGRDYAWHIDGVLDYSTAHAINNLDLYEVTQRGYFNLRLSWDNACPAWINTSMRLESPEFSSKLRQEEPFVREAFEWFLPDHALPQTFSAPCCSQFAVTRTAIRSLPRETYKLAMDWIVATHLPSSVTGRVFEHLWQYMFLLKPIDCPSEFKALCRMYHVCFADEDEWERWRSLERERWKINDFRNALLRNGYPRSNVEVVRLEKESNALDKDMVPCKMRAIQRGRSRKMRMELARGEL